MTWYHHKRSPKAQKGLFPKVLVSDLSKLPIRMIDSSCERDVDNYENISVLVDQMLQTQKDSRNAKSEADKNLYEQKISMIDKKIDELVYKLYGLTEDEIKIVEGE